MFAHIPANGKTNNPIGEMNLKCIVGKIDICAQGEVIYIQHTFFPLLLVLK